mmetsp:Transcript_13182/g.31594  ORF Transcript_13182/g.31594 Transcript_13182/m.31594 type:complete len:93 (-) Transcript_13182:4883-5161(-)
MAKKKIEGRKIMLPTAKGFVADELDEGDDDDDFDGDDDDDDAGSVAKTVGGNDSLPPVDDDDNEDDADDTKNKDKSEASGYLLLHNATFGTT